MARSQPSSGVPTEAGNHFLPVASEGQEFRDSGPGSLSSPDFVTSFPAPPPSSAKGEEGSMHLHLMGDKLSDSLNLVTGQEGGDVSEASVRR